MRRSFLITALLSFFTQTALAASPGSLLTYEGVLTDSGGTPITSSQTVTFSVLYGSCVVYSETQNITPGSVGEFSVVVGTGTRTDTTNNTADRIFASSGTVNCQGAAAASMPGFTTRALRINVGGTDLTPDVTIGNIPVSINSQKLADKGPSDFLQVNAALGTTQANLESILARFTSLDSLLTAYSGGTLTAQSATNFTGSLAGDVGGTQGATVVNRIKGVNLDMTGLTSGKILKYNGTAFSVADDNTGTSPGDASYAVKGLVQFDTNASISGVNVSAGVVRVNVGTSADQIVKLDSMAKLPAVDGSALTNLPKEIPTGATSGQVLSSTGSALQWITPSTTDSTKLPLAGGTMSGAIEMGSNNLTNVGYVTMSANKSLHLSNNPSDPSLSTADKGKIWFNSTSNQIKYWDGSSTQTLGVAGSGISSLNGLTGAAQTFGTIGTSGNNPNWSSTGAIHTLNIPMASVSGVTAGLITKAEYDAFNAKQATGNYITALTGDVTATGPNSAAATISNGVITTAKIADGTVTATDMNFTGTNGALASLVLKDSTGKFADFNCSTAGQIPTWTVTGFVCQTPTALLPTLADSRIWVGNGSSIATAVPVSGDASLSNTGALTLATVGAGGSGVTKITFDTKGRVTAGTALAQSDIISTLGYTPVNKAGDAMTGSLGFANYTASSETTMTSGLTTSDKGKTWFNSTTNQIKFWDGSTAQTLGVAGSGVTNVSGTAPISVTNGTTTPTISVTAATSSALGVVQVGTGLSVSSGVVSADPANFPSAVPITKGGTGATTATAAFMALSPMTAKGDLISRTASSPAVLAVGTAGQVLTVDSAETTGLKWATPTATDLTTVVGTGIVQRTGAGSYATLGTTAPIAVVGSSIVLNTVPLASGGTGATTKTAAFNALSPIATKGDLITFDGTNNVRLPAGTNNQLLVTDSAQASGLKWVSPIFFSNGGNSFGADATLGTIDAFKLNLVAGGATKMSINPSGNVVLGAGSLPLSNGNTGPGVLTLHGGGSGISDPGSIEMTNPLAQASLLESTFAGRLTFNILNNPTPDSTKTSNIATITALTDGADPNDFSEAGGTYGYGGKLMFSTRAHNTTASSPAAQMVITSTGNVGMGISNPSERLQVKGNIAPTLDATYNVGTAALRFNYIYAANSVIQTSDARMKRDIQETDLGLDFINKLRPVSYYWKDGSDEKLHYGLIAQETEQVVADFKLANGRTDEVENVIVAHDKKTDRYGVRYTELISPLIKAVQELYHKLLGVDRELELLEAKVQQLESESKTKDRKIQSLEQENEAVKTRLEKIEKALGSK